MTERRVAAFIFDVWISAASQQSIEHFDIATRSRRDQSCSAIGVLCIRIDTCVQERVDRHHVASLRSGEETLLVKLISTQFEEPLRALGRRRTRTGFHATTQTE